MDVSEEPALPGMFSGPFNFVKQGPNPLFDIIPRAPDGIEFLPIRIVQIPIPVFSRPARRADPLRRTTHGDDVIRIDQLLRGDVFRYAITEIHALFAHHLDHLRVDVVGRIGPPGSNVDLNRTVLLLPLGKRRCHLASTRVLHTDERHTDRILFSWMVYEFIPLPRLTVRDPFEGHTSFSA